MLTAVPPQVAVPQSASPTRIPQSGNRESVDAEPVRRDPSIDTTAEEHGSRLKSRVRELERALRIAKWQHLNRFVRTRCVPVVWLYLGIARFFRVTMVSILGWRWAVVLLGSTISAALLFVPFLSWVAGLMGLIFGVALFSCLEYVPADLDSFAKSVQETVTAFNSRRLADRESLARIATDLAAAKKEHRRWADAQKIKTDTAPTNADRLATSPIPARPMPAQQVGFAPVSTGPRCQACGGDMVKASITSGACGGCALVMLTLCAGIIVFIVIPVIGWVAGPIIILCSLFMSIGNRRKVWRCRNCRAIIDRG